MRELLWVLLTLTLVSGFAIKSDDLKSVLEDIVKRLDEKEVRIRQLEENAKEQTVIVNELTSTVNQHEQTINELRNTISNDFGDGNVTVNTTQETILKRLDEKEARIKQLEENAKVQTATVNELTSTVNQHEQTINELRDFISHDVRDGNITVNTAHDSVGQSKRDVAMTNGSRIQRRDTENPVAFLATLSAHAKHMIKGQSIPFDNVITNIGEGYNSTVGGFFAPVSGIYVFSTTIMTPNRKTNNHYAFCRNGDTVTRLFYHGNYIRATDTASHTITLQLNRSDNVTVVNRDLDKDVWGNHYSSFTGFLLHEIYDGTTVVNELE